MALTKVTGELVDIGDLDISNVGSIQLDSIAGDADSNTSITFSGSDVITVATGGTTALTIDANQKLTANSGVAIDNITIDGTEIDLSSGDLTLDVAGDIIFDADGDDFRFDYAGTTHLYISNNSGNTTIQTAISDEDLVFKGNDGGSTITALTLDMSDAGKAQFNSSVGIGAAPSTDLFVYNSSALSHIRTNSDVSQSNGAVFGKLSFQGNDNEEISLRAFYDHATSAYSGLSFHYDGAAGTVEAMRITSAGKVGIGATPTYHFDVNNVAEDDDLYMSLKCDNSRQANIFFSDQDNNYPGYIGYNHASNFLMFATASSGNGSERMRITSDGKVGINTTSPDDLLDIMGGGYDQIRIGSNKTDNTNKQCGIVSTMYTNNSVSLFQGYFQNGENTLYYGSADGAHRGINTHIFYVNAGYNATTSHTEAMRIDSGGHVGINMGTNTTALADHFLSIGTASSNGTIGSEGFVHIGPKPGATDRNTDGYISGISLGYGENNDSYKHAGIAARAHGDGAARRDMVFLVNSTSEAASAELGDAKLTISSGNGTVSGDLNDTSDLGFKENVADLGNTLSIVKQLKPRTFTWKDERASRGDSVGFIAQEVKAIVSDNTLVTGEEYDPDNLKMTGLSLNTVGLVAYLTKAIQELSANNDALEARIATLEE